MFRKFFALLAMAMAVGDGAMADECKAPKKSGGITLIIAAAETCPQFAPLSKVDWPTLVLVSGVMTREQRDNPWCWREMQKHIDAEIAEWKRWPDSRLKPECAKIEAGLRGNGTYEVLGMFSRR